VNASIKVDELQHVLQGFLQWYKACLRSKGDHFELFV
jgi:hypothetical protein